MSSSNVTTEASTEDPVTHRRAETRFVDSGGVRFAYRRFGSPERRR